jgi:hypothetical protein
VPHITNAIGVASLSENGEEIFTPIVPPETAVPARRTVQVAGPRAGGDVLIKVVEGNTHIKVTKPEPKAKEEPTSNGNSKKATVEDDEEDADDEDDSDDDDEEEEEEKREKVYKVGPTLAEAAVRGVKPGAKVEITINVTADLEVTVTAREAGAKTGIRGTITP